MADFIGGKALCRAFFQEAVKPVLSAEFPGLCYAAGLVGYGSDVLGYDDEVSTDHMWGPRLYLFLREEDYSRKTEIWDVLCHSLPCSFGGYSVNFSVPDPNDNGVQHPEPISEGPVNPLIWIHTPRGFLKQYLGSEFPEKWTDVDWLACSEHRLLALHAGELFQDEIGAGNSLQALKFYPPTVQRYLLASNWSLIAEEQAFLRRCGDRGDDIGSRLVCARMAERLMRLCFLYCRQYAPYSKWFGTAFAGLPIPAKIGEQLKRALAADELDIREDAMIQAQLAIAELHNRSGLTAPVQAEDGFYFGRKIRVIRAEHFADALARGLEGTTLDGIPLIGSLSEVANLTAISDHPSRQYRVRSLYCPKN